MLVSGAAAGYLIGGEVPEGWVFAGALIIVASGLLSVLRGAEAAASTCHEDESSGGTDPDRTVATARETVRPETG